MAKDFWVYILSSRSKGALYIDVTSNLVQRVWEHKNRMVEGFTCRYNVDRLVHYAVRVALGIWCYPLSRTRFVQGDFVGEGETEPKQIET